jgi:hypothetical protein
MKRILLNILTIRIRKNSGAYQAHFLNLFYGLIGFLSFLSIIIAAKFISYVSNQEEQLNIDIYDFLLSLFGFAMIYIFKELENKNRK